MPKHKQMMRVELPYFPGFYESWFSDAIDWEQEQWCEARATEDNGSDDDECRWPEPMRLTECDLNDLLYRTTAYSDAYAELARQWAWCFNEMATEALGFKTHIGYERTDSPKYYNFESDRVFAHIPLSVVRRIFALSRRDGHAERHTSRSGFSSFYTTDLDAWLTKPLADWDHNELSTLLIAALDLQGYTADSTPNTYDTGLMKYLSDETLDRGFAYTAWESAVDWNAFEHARAVLRDDKRIEWEAANPGQHLPTPIFRDARQLALPLATGPQPRA